MSQELVKQDGNKIQVFNFFDAAQFETVQRVSTMFANSELVPDLYKISPNNPAQKAVANCMIAIETATRIGASPLMVMQNMNIIYGRPSWSAKFLIATVNACGKYESIKYKLRLLGSAKGTTYTEYKWDAQAKKKLPTVKVFEEDVENWECIAYTKERGSTEVLESTPITVKMAIEEGWYTKDGSKWRTMPKVMLQYRAAAFWTNSYAPELSMGIKTTEEIQDFVDIEYEDVSHTVDKTIKNNANKQNISMDDDAKPEAQVDGEKSETPKEESNPI